MTMERQGTAVPHRQHASAVAMRPVALLAVSYALLWQLPSVRLTMWSFMPLLSPASQVNDRIRTAAPRKQSITETDGTALQSEELEIRKAKELLRDYRVPVAGAIAILEKQMAQLVTKVSQLEGTWTLMLPRKNTRAMRQYLIDRKSIPGTSLVSEPIMIVAADGRGVVSRSQAKIGLQEMKMMRTSDITITGPNLLREQVKSVTPAFMRYAYPRCVRTRSLKIVYLDDELMVTRDSYNLIDVWWKAARRGKRAMGNIESVPTSLGVLSQALKHTATSSPVGVKAQNETQRILTDVEALKGLLDAERKQAAQDNQQRKTLNSNIAKIQRSIDCTSLDARACAAQIQAMQELQGRTLEGNAVHREHTQEMTNALHQLQVKSDILASDMQDCKTSSDHGSERKKVLLEQISELKLERRKVPRKERVAYGKAISQALKEVKTVTEDIRLAQKKSATLQKQSSSIISDMQLQQLALDEALASEASYQARMDEQRRQVLEQEAHLSAALAMEQDLKFELEESQARLREIDLHKIRARELAVEANAVISSLMKQSRGMKHVARRLGRRSWLSWLWS